MNYKNLSSYTKSCYPKISEQALFLFVTAWYEIKEKDSLYLCEIKNDMLKRPLRYSILYKLLLCKWRKFFLKERSMTHHKRHSPIH